MYILFLKCYQVVSIICFEFKYIIITNQIIKMSGLALEYLAVNMP